MLARRKSSTERGRPIVRMTSLAWMSSMAWSVICVWMDCFHTNKRKIQSFFSEAATKVCVERAHAETAFYY